MRIIWLVLAGAIGAISMSLTYAQNANADVKDADAVPFLNEDAKKAYKEWTTAPFHRAFAINPTNGGFGIGSGERIESFAVDTALEKCPGGKSDCFVYAINDRVVWNGKPSQPILGSSPPIKETANLPAPADSPLNAIKEVGNYSPGPSQQINAPPSPSSSDKAADLRSQNNDVASSVSKPLSDVNRIDRWSGINSGHIAFIVLALMLAGFLTFKITQWAAVNSKRKRLSTVYQSLTEFGTFLEDADYKKAHFEKCRMKDQGVEPTVEKILIEVAYVYAYSLCGWKAGIGQINEEAYQRSMESYQLAMQNYGIALQLWRQTNSPRDRFDPATRLFNPAPSKPSQPAEKEFVTYYSKEGGTYAKSNLGWVLFSKVPASENWASALKQHEGAIIASYASLLDQLAGGINNSETAAELDSKDKSIIVRHPLPDNSKSVTLKSIKAQHLPSKTENDILAQFKETISSQLLSNTKSEIKGTYNYYRNIEILEEGSLFKIDVVGLPIVVVQSSVGDKTKITFHDHREPQVAF